MALQLGLRRGYGLASIAAKKSTAQSSAFVGGFSQTMMRWKSTDAGDVIGIDLGTTNSCVAIMVSSKIGYIQYLCLPILQIQKLTMEIMFFEHN